MGAAAGGIDEVATEGVATGVVGVDSEWHRLRILELLKGTRGLLQSWKARYRSMKQLWRRNLVTGEAEEVRPAGSEATVATVATNTTPEDMPVADEDVIAEGAEVALPEHIPIDDVSAEDAPLRAEARTRPEHQLCCGVAPSGHARETIGETGGRACGHQRTKK